MKNLIVGVIIIFLFNNSDFGSATAYLNCKSESGRTQFNAELQDVTGLMEKAELKVDDSKISFKTDESHAIFDPKNGVFTMCIYDKVDENFPNHKFIEFWAIPSSFNIVKDENGYQIYSFKAKIYGTEPRKDKAEFHIPTITLNCKLEYKI